MDQTEVQNGLEVARNAHRALSLTTEQDRVVALAIDGLIQAVAGLAGPVEVTISAQFAAPVESGE